MTAEQKTVHQIQLQKQPYLESVDGVRQWWLDLADEQLKKPCRADEDLGRWSMFRSILPTREELEHKAAYFRKMAIDRLPLPVDKTGKGCPKRHHEPRPIQSYASRSSDPDYHERQLSEAIGRLDGMPQPGYRCGYGSAKASAVQDAADRDKARRAEQYARHWAG